MRGEIPRLLQLVYLGNGEVVALRPRRARPARHRAQRQGALGRRRARRAHRRLAPAHLAAVRLVRLPRPLPRVGRHSPAAARGRRRRSRSTRRAQARSCPPTTEAERAASASARRPGSSPDNVSRCTAPADLGHRRRRAGTASVGTPAATAERTPVGESSMATQSSRRRRRAAVPRRGRARGAACRASTSSPVTTRRRRPSGQRDDDGIGERPPRHRHERARDARVVQGGEQLARARPPRHVLADPVDDAVQQLVDDPLRRPTSTGEWSLDELRRDRAGRCRPAGGRTRRSRCRRAPRRSRARRRSSTARCRRGCRPCPRGRLRAGSWVEESREP